MNNNIGVVGSLTAAASTMAIVESVSEKFGGPFSSVGGTIFVCGLIATTVRVNAESGTRFQDSLQKSVEVFSLGIGASALGAVVANGVGASPLETILYGASIAGAVRGAENAYYGKSVIKGVVDSTFDLACNITLAGLATLKLQVELEAVKLGYTKICEAWANHD